MRHRVQMQGNVAHWYQYQDSLGLLLVQTASSYLLFEGTDSDSVTINLMTNSFDDQYDQVKMVIFFRSIVHLVVTYGSTV